MFFDLLISPKSWDFFVYQSLDGEMNYLPKEYLPDPY